MRKKTAMVLAGALVLAVMLNGCGGQGAGTAGGEKASEEEVSGEEANGQESVSDEGGDDSGEQAEDSGEIAVSYTHLDVYKRQGGGCVRAGGADSFCRPE